MLTSSGDFITCDKADIKADVDGDSRVVSRLMVLPSDASLCKKCGNLSSDTSQDSLCTQKHLSLSLDSLRQSSLSCDEVSHHWERVSLQCCVLTWNHIYFQSTQAQNFKPLHFAF